MAAQGAKYKWFEGKILHASRFYKSPTKRRVPRILIEDRAMEVGIKLHIDAEWMVYEETAEKSSEISLDDGVELNFYYNRYHLFPETFKRQDTYDWLKKPGNFLLLWAKNGHYFVKSYNI